MHQRALLWREAHWQIRQLQRQVVLHQQVRRQCVYRPPQELVQQLRYQCQGKLTLSGRLCTTRPRRRLPHGSRLPPSEWWAAPRGCVPRQTR
mmetsp:Transcript_71588/g.173368  ORF Transcript_71588/g.173368 Transcript_71588/m.173368 type:complete len:92 (+) Transcript_71588:642-917(+)